MAICGAKTCSGQPCKKSPLSGKKRCRLHGGNAGAPKGNQNTKKAGSLYSAFFTPEENTISENLDLTRIDDELKLIKIRLIRALKLEAEQGIDTVELESTTTKNDQTGESVQEVSKRKDYTAIINTLTARIQSLTTQRNTLIGQSLDAQLKQLEIDKIKNGDGDNADDATPVKVTINVVNASK